jgi:hypothetical protein
MARRVQVPNPVKFSLEHGLRDEARIVQLDPVAENLVLHSSVKRLNAVLSVVLDVPHKRGKDVREHFKDSDETQGADNPLADFLGKIGFDDLSETKSDDKHGSGYQDRRPEHEALAEFSFFHVLCICGGPEAPG